MPEFRDNNGRSLIVCGLWLHAGLIGISALAIGALQLLNGGTNAAEAIALAICGTALAAGSWRRGRSALEESGDASPVVNAEPLEAQR